MANLFGQPDRCQLLLLPVDVIGWLPDGDIVHIIVDAARLMGFSDLGATCKLGCAGVDDWAVIASLVETCKLNSVEPHAYLTNIIPRIANAYPNSRIDELMP